MSLFSNVIITLTSLLLMPEQPAGALVYFWLISTLGGMLSLYIIKHEADARLLFKQYKFQANYDFLTGIFNKRKFEEVSRVLYDRASQSPRLSSRLFIWILITLSRSMINTAIMKGTKC